jgi:hypothetical protein
MRRHLLIVAPAVLAGVLGPVTAARAAQLTTDRKCYLQTPRTAVTINATGLPAGVPYTVSLDGTVLQGGAGTTDAAGAMTGRLTPPALERRRGQRTFRIVVRAGGAVVVSRFTLTRVLARFNPATGDTATLGVRFSAYGFGLRDEGKPAPAIPPSVYVHYLRPGGKLERTVRLGRVSGSCGSILRTRERRLFPFIAEPGLWRLQFDTRSNYTPGTSRSTFIWSPVSVRVRRAG